MTVENVEITIGPVAPGGRWFCRMEDGTPLFVSGAVEGERVVVGHLRRRARVAEGAVVEVLEPSADRVEPPCAWADRCGGCDWMHLSAGAQLDAKRSIAMQAAKRQARIELDPEPPITPSPALLGYRSRIRLHVDRRGTIGYFARGSHDVVEIPDCPIARPTVNEALIRLRAELDAAGLGPEVSGVELREGDESAPWAVHLFMRSRRARPSARLSAQLEILAADGAAVWVGGHPLNGPSRLRYPLPGGLFLLAGPSTFTQANPAANEPLVSRVVDLVGSAGPFLDLYCGAGNFTLPLSAVGIDGVGVELSRDAVACGLEAAALQSLPADCLEQARVDDRLSRRLSAHHPDVVILDPPRTGARDAIPLLSEIAPSRIVYVGCDPVTQARDVGSLRQRGYELRSWELFDLFPQTHHVEGVVELVST
jgi:23S rRNA (uracil1939-C5)-methyltransferase